MGGFSIWHWLIVGIVVLLLFGRGRISDVMGDFGKGIKSFKKAMDDGDDEVTTRDEKAATRRIEDKRAAADIAARDRDNSNVS